MCRQLLSSLTLVLLATECIVDVGLATAKHFARRSSVWPTLHKDYQRSGYTDELVDGPYERKWYRDFHDEMIATRVEAIIAEGKCYVGTFAGNLYALDITDGRTIWRFKADGPIGASPCYGASFYNDSQKGNSENGRLYIGADEGFETGHLYCVNAADGSLMWRYKAGAGIWVSPACDGAKVYFGDRAGVFHAVRVSDGKRAWTFQTGGMILKPASFSPDNKKIVFGSEDMHVYCLDPAGKLLWKSKKLEGLSMRDQAPTIWQDLVIIRTNPADSFHTVLGRNGDLLKKIQLSMPKTEGDKVLLDKWNDLIMHPTPRRREAEQAGIIEYLRQNPYDQCFYAFSLANGQEPWIAPVFYTCGLHNPPTPPTFNPRTGELYTFCRSALTYYLRGVRRYNALGRLDRETGRFDFYWPEADDGRGSQPPLLLAQESDGAGVPGRWYRVATIGDEAQALSLMGNILLSTHQGTLAGLDLKSGKVVTIWAGRDTYGGIFGPGAVPGKFKGAKELAGKGYLTGMPNEWHGPDRSICAIAEGRLFWVVGSQVVCIAGPNVPKADTGGLGPAPLKKSKLPACIAAGNVASRGTGSFDRTLAKITLQPSHVTGCVDCLPDVALQQSTGKLAKALRARLDIEVLQLVNRWPWAPFIVELGISGEERYFWRTSETIQIMSLALPHLSTSARKKAIVLLDMMFESGMPLAKPVHARDSRRREPYKLGPGMKKYAETAIDYHTNIEDLYAVWAYAHYANRWERVLAHSGEIQHIFASFAAKDFKFDHQGTNDEAEHLNRQIAGVLAAARILKRAGETDDAAQAQQLLAQMVTERIHHERADSALIRPTHVASKDLHQAKVPRYVALVPEVAETLRELACEPLTRNVRDLTTGLPLWYQAFGERMIGGENYISPPHLSCALFTTLADGLHAEPNELAAKLDQPWCKADLYYIEKISAILRRLDGSGLSGKLD